MIRYRTVNRKHRMCKGPCPVGLPAPMRRFWHRFDLDEPCDGAVVAYHKGQIIGFFRFFKKKQERFLYAAGTYVVRKYRKDGVAKKMWMRALKRTKPKEVEVYVASKGGRKLVESLRKKYEGKIFFYVNGI